MGFSVTNNVESHCSSQAVLWKLLVKQKNALNLLLTQRNKGKILLSDFSNPFTST